MIPKRLKQTLAYLLFAGVAIYLATELAKDTSRSPKTATPRSTSQIR